MPRRIPHIISNYGIVYTTAYTVREAAELLGYSPSNIRRLTHKNTLKRENSITSKILIEERSLMEYKRTYID